MPIELEWALEDRVIIHRNVGDITIDEMIEIDGPLNAMLDAALDHPIHMVVVANPHGKAPLSLNAFMAATWPRHRRLGWTVVVGLENKVLQFVAGTAAQIAGMKATFVDGVINAALFLRDVDGTLPPDFALQDVGRHQKERD